VAGGNSVWHARRKSRFRNSLPLTSLPEYGVAVDVLSMRRRMFAPAKAGTAPDDPLSPLGHVSNGLVPLPYKSLGVSGICQRSEDCCRIRRLIARQTSCDPARGRQAHRVPLHLLTTCWDTNRADAGVGCLASTRLCFPNGSCESCYARLVNGSGEGSSSRHYAGGGIWGLQTERSVH
jgi:hypothetical protein